MTITALVAAAVAVAWSLWPARAAVTVAVAVTAVTGAAESRWTAVYGAGREPLLLGNDAAPDRGGFHAYRLDARGLDADLRLSEAGAVVVGRTKLVTTVYGVGGRDLAIIITQPDSLLRAYELPSLAPIHGVERRLLGDWSALCPWQSTTGTQYAFLFGKHRALQLLLRAPNGTLAVTEVQSFDMPFEASACAAARESPRMFLSAGNDMAVYALSLHESTRPPKLSKVLVARDLVTGLTVYVSGGARQYFLFVSSKTAIAVYGTALTLVGILDLSGEHDVEIKGLDLYQASTSAFPAGVLTYALKSGQGKAFGVTSLAGVLEKLGLAPNTNHDPSQPARRRRKSPICTSCAFNGYCLEASGVGGLPACECFAGYGGDDCQEHSCVDDCSGHGRCIGPNTCQCDADWGGLHCSFLLVEPSFETDAHGRDGDDPAIWISPVSRNLSRIITTTKSNEDAGLAIFDLTGHLLQTVRAGKPNNVDIIYGFAAGSRTVDLAFAACRQEDTLCLFEIHPNGTLTTIPGGVQPVMAGFKVYGSCPYRSPKSGKQFLFVNEKSARYLQYELTATADGTLQVTLVREFRGGSGGQVEGCVADEENSWLFLGEEPSALWKYGAEPDSSVAGVAIARVGDGRLYGDVEGVTLVLGPSSGDGFIIVSCQGVSAFNVYRRAQPHEYVTTFTIVESADGRVDSVSNTDGVAAVGTALGPHFPHGILVTHDDANQLPDGSTSPLASFKLVSLEKMLGAPQLKNLELLQQVDGAWNPRRGAVALGHQ